MNGMTMKQAMINGYTLGRTAYQRGYISRKQDNDTAVVRISGNGLPYVLIPNYNSTRYCIRQYLIAPQQ